MGGSYIVGPITLFEMRETFWEMLECRWDGKK